MANYSTRTTCDLCYRRTVYEDPEKQCIFVCFSYACTELLAIHAPWSLVGHWTKYRSIRWKSSQLSYVLILSTPCSNLEWCGTIAKRASAEQHQYVLDDIEDHIGTTKWPCELDTLITALSAVLFWNGQSVPLKNRYMYGLRQNRFAYLSNISY